jgi:hypothetical protein
MYSLQYDLRTAYEMGYTEHPQIVMQKLGYDVLVFEAVEIADCVLMGVDKLIEPLPRFLKLYTEVRYTPNNN